MKLLMSSVFVVAMVLFARSTTLSAPSSAEPLPRFLGAGSCAASGCHGTPGPAAASGSEYPTWISFDKHAHAYEVLFEPRSRKMVKALGRGSAHEDTLCLSCHVHPDFAGVATRAPESFRSDGVSCETCHGPAERWLADHYKPAWQQLSSQEKQTLGMRDTKSLPGRARLCVDCHVGSAKADVNHDLIAAGHPRLNFEFAGYHARWQRHWPDSLDKDPATGGRADFEASAWLIGQLETASAALRLLDARAADQHKPWPEFTEMDCFACHHDLQANSWRQRPGHYQLKPGSIPWNSWYAAESTTALAVSGDEKAAGSLQAALANINRAVAGNAKRKRVAALTRAAQAELDGAIANQRNNSGLDIRKLFDALSAKEKPRNWDEATQRYLGLAAVHNAWMDEKDFAPAGRLKARLLELRETLRFPAGMDSPRAFEGR